MATLPRKSCPNGQVFREERTGGSSPILKHAIKKPSLFLAKGFVIYYLPMAGLEPARGVSHVRF